MRVHHIAFRTHNLAALGHFYSRIFGLALVKDQGRSLWFSLGDAVLMLEEAGDGEPGVPGGSMEFLALRVTAEEREALAARALAAGHPIEHRTAHTLYLRDPDGRRVGVSDHPLDGVAVAPRPQGD